MRIFWFEQGYELDNDKSVHIHDISKAYIMGELTGFPDEQEVGWDRDRESKSREHRQKKYAYTDTEKQPLTWNILSWWCHIGHVWK